MLAALRYMAQNSSNQLELMKHVAEQQRKQEDRLTTVEQQTEILIKSQQRVA